MEILRERITELTAENHLLKAQIDSLNHLVDFSPNIFILGFWSSQECRIRKRKQYASADFEVKRGSYAPNY
jgi:hypothetical protein